VADDSLARAGLATLLAEQPDFVVVGQAAEIDLAASLEAYSPDVLVWDLGWNPVPTIERLAALEDNQAPIVALLPNEDHVAEARAAGAQALLSRNADVESIGAAIVAVSRGLMVLDPAFAAAPARGWAAGPAEELTSRERDVLRLLADGLPNKLIAQRLGISEHTVKFHVNAILGKLGAQSRTEAVTRAARLGLIAL